MIGLVFEGCVCRAAFHAGVADVLAAEGVPFGIAAGASSGSIVAAALAAGLGRALPELFERFSGRSIVSWRRALHNRSPFDMSTIVRDALRDTLGDGDLREAPLEALCTATRARDFQTLVLSSRDEPDFVTAILGSCFFPILYGRTIRLRGELVIDGGITDNLPLGAVAARGATTLLAVFPAHDGTALSRPLRPRVRPGDPAVGQALGVKVIAVHPDRPLAVRAWDLDRERVKDAIAAGRRAGERAVTALERDASRARSVECHGGSRACHASSVGGADMDLERAMNGVTKVAEALGALAIGSSAAAETGAPPVPPEVSAMLDMVGTWRGPATMTQGKDAQALDVTMTCQAVAGGSAVACQTHMQGQGFALEESDLFAWDPAARKYHWYAATNVGDAHDHVADAPAAKGGALAFVHHGTLAGKPFTETIGMSFRADCRHFDIKSQGTLGGQPIFTLAGSADKQ
ncbi:MAG: patatin-like phospholipase family protein [Myxococcota bacterium]